MTNAPRERHGGKRLAAVAFVLLTSAMTCHTAAADVDGDTPKLPDNAHARTYGRGWDCNYGFRQSGAACRAIQVPENGYLIDSGSGKGWDCHRGHRAYRNECRRIAVPENGYLTNSRSGSGWDCERGFKANGDACVAVEIPMHAHLNRDGDGWDCNRPYRRRDDGCVLP